MIRVECYVNGLRDDCIDLPPDMRAKIEKELGESLSAIRVDAETDSLTMNITVNGEKATGKIKKMIDDFVSEHYER